MLLSLLQDGCFAAIAAIGFAAISRPPRTAYVHCAFIAAVGHGIRFVLMRNGVHIVPAALVAALAIGLLATFLARRAKCPPETFTFPALLPMIPGMYAYNTVKGLVMCAVCTDETQFLHYFHLMAANGLVCSLAILAMVGGVTVPILLLKNVSFSATRA
mgnify:CR=1 FL=1